MRLAIAVVTAGFLAVPGLASAQQPIESVGGRALGMGGAFVAVADDASATHWNPAGLATAGPAGTTIGWVDFHTGNQEGAPITGQARRSSYSWSLGTWPLGISLTRIKDTRVVSVVGDVATTQTLSTGNYGLNILQSLSRGLVVGANIKWVRGTVSETVGTGVSADQLFSDGTEVSSHLTNAFDLDLSVMADLKPLRLGVIVKNVREPEFTNAAGIAIRTPREIRGGIALMPHAGVTLALDMDLDTVDLWDGPRRMIAFGGEGHVTQKLAVRAGVRWNRKDALRSPVYTAGTSVRLSKRSWVDVHYTHGRDLTSEKGFGAALRAGF